MKFVELFVWFIVFIDIVFGRIMNKDEAEIIALMSWITNTDFGLRNTLTLAIITLSLRLIWGWSMASIVLAMFIVLFRFASCGARPIIKK